MLWHGIFRLMVTLIQLAREFGIDKSNTRKYLLRKGFKFTTIRIKKTGNQKNLALSEDDAKKAKEIRLMDGFELIKL